MGITMLISVKILSMNYPERYAVRRLVAAAHQELLSKYPSMELDIIEISDPGVIGRYSFVLVLPTLVINEKVVCSGSFPTKKEITSWLLQAPVES
jgi:hypothetical protein